MKTPLVTLRRVIATVVALAAVGLCVSAGLWQLRRLDEKRANNVRLLDRSEAEPVELGSLGELSDGDFFTRVRVAGRFDPSREVLVLGRPLDGKAGNHVMTLLMTAQGPIWVDRGWVPPEYETAPVVDAPPPTGEVTVEGILMRGEKGPGTVGGEPQRSVPRPDLRLLDRSVEGGSLPLYLVARAYRPPAQEALPEFSKVSATDEGPHLSYAIQWFVFAAIAVVGWVVLMRRTRSGLADPVDFEEVGVGEPERD